MMRKLAMAMVVSGALGSSYANALGLGEITMNSAINQPLDAEVKLLNVGDLSKNEILPNLGSHEDFSRAGVERVFFLTGIQFDVELDGKGGAVIHLTSDRIVREPFLNFLVELHWPSGRLLREYTTFLDPPLFSEAAPVPVQQAVTQAPAPVESYAPPYKTSTPAVSSAQPKSSSASAPFSEKRDGIVRVKKNDTLWGIAKENRPDTSVTVRQTMLAIQEHNPDAFIRNNINLMKSGQVLRIPELEEIRRVSSSQAYTETTRQNEEWTSKKTIDATQNYNSAPTDDAAAGVEQGGLLKLVATDADSAEDELSASASGGSADGETTGSGNQAGEGSSEQGAGSTVADVENLEKELQDIQRLLTLKQEQLALLQITQADEALAESEAQAVAALEAEADLQAAAELAGQENEATNQTVSVDGEVVVVEETLIEDSGQDDASQVAEIEAAAAEEARPEESILDILTNNPLYIGVMIVVILGALILLGAISRRRNEEKEYPQDLQQAVDASENEVELPDELDELLDVDSIDEIVEAAPTVGALVDEEPLDLDTDVNVEAASETGDESRKLLEEADIYIAYGRYERAVEILQPAVNDAPRDTALRLKLAEIFLASNDGGGFSQQEADLNALGDAQALAKLDELKTKYADLSPAEVSQETMVESMDESVETEQSDAADDGLIEFSTEADGEDEDFFDIDEDDSEEDNSLEFSLDEDDEQADEPQQGSDDADDMDFLVDTDESATKLELAKAYIDMADAEAAQEILNEVIADGSDEQQDEAKKLLDNLV